MRKFLPLVAVSLMALPLAACGEAGSGDEAAPAAEEAAPAMEEAAPAMEEGTGEEATADDGAAAEADERGNVTDRGPE